MILEQAAGTEAPDTSGITPDVIKRHKVKSQIDVVILELCRLLTMSDVDARDEVVSCELTLGGNFTY